jgi:transposase
VEIDNNLVENRIRPTKLGAKNWLFIGCAKAGQKAAILYTIVENCRRLGIDTGSIWKTCSPGYPA